MTSYTEEKQQQMLMFVKRVLIPEPVVKAGVSTGRIVTGLAQPEPDIDAFVFFDPLDRKIIMIG